MIQRFKSNAILVLVLGALLAIPAWSQAGTGTDLTRAELQVLEGMQSALRKVSSRALPVVVEINTVELVQQRGPSTVTPFEFFFGQPQDDRPGRDSSPQRRSGLGSGVIVRRVGNTVYVLTNNHVAGEATEITVRLSDGREFKAELVGSDPRRDLALVRFETAEPVAVAQLGDSDKVQPGDIVITVGNPLGFESTVTMGVISAVGRRADSFMGQPNFTDYIQTDAPINQGNSGGALINIYGEVIGINTWIASQSGGSIGLGFAIPINTAKRAIDDFINKGNVEYGWLGVNTGEAPKELRDALNIKTDKGAFVFDIFRGSPAMEAGLQPGDFITKVNTTEIRNSGDLVQAVGNLAPGVVTDFTLVRYGETIVIKVKTGVRDRETDSGKMIQKVWPGIVVVEMTDRIKKELRLTADVGKIVIGRITEGSSAESAGLRAGDIIKEVNGKKVASIMEFYKAINEPGRREVMLRIYRGGNEFFIGLVK